MISKELLSEIFGTDVKKVVMDISEIHYNINNMASKSEIAIYIDGWKLYNIYELNQKCKEWAYDNDHPLTIIWANNIVHVRTGEKRFYSNEKDEVSGVFEACEWIVKEINAA